MRRSVERQGRADDMGVRPSSRVPALRRLRDERGQAMVEFALVLLLFLMVLFAIFEFGLTYRHYLTITDAARVGARAAAVARTGSQCAAATAAVESAVSPGDWSTIVASGGVGCVSSWQAGDPVTIDVRYPYSIDIVGVPLYEGTLDAKATERVE